MANGKKLWFYIFQDPKDTPPPTRVETREERIERRRRERAEQVAYKLEREIATWDPNQLADATADPFKTLFVARIVCILWMSDFNRVVDKIVYSLSYRIMTPLNLSCAVSSKYMVKSLKLLSYMTRRPENLEDTPLLSMNMKGTCTVSTTFF